MYSKASFDGARDMNENKFSFSHSLVEVGANLEFSIYKKTMHYA